MDDYQRSTKIYQKLSTDGARNHVLEVNNPFPESIKDGKYIAYIPD